MTLFCKLVLADGTEVGKVNTLTALPTNYTISHGGKVYRIKAGQLLEPEPGHHVADGLLLTVEDIEEKGKA